MANTTLIHFNGTNGSTTIVNDGTGGATFSFAGSCALSTTAPKFGSAAASMPGGGGGIFKSSDIGPVTLGASGWTVNEQMRIESATSHVVWRWIDSISTIRSVQLFFDAGTNKLQLSLSSEANGGALFDICNALAGTKNDYATGAYYHLELARDVAGGKYYLYVGGVKDIEVTSSAEVNTSGITTFEGAGTSTGGNSLNGYIDEFRIADACVHPGGMTFTPPTAEYGSEVDFSAVGSVAMGVHAAADYSFLALTNFSMTGNVAMGVHVAATSSFLIVTIFSATGNVAMGVHIAGVLTLKGITESAISATDGVVLVGLTAHGFSDGDPVTIAGADQPEYNGTFNITYVGPNAFSYVVNGTPASPATGSITATGYDESYFPGVAYAQYANLDLVLHETNGIIYSIDPTAFQDDGVPIDCLLRTAPWDGGTQHWKFITPTCLIGDKVDSSALVRYTDDDYQTYSIFRPIDLSVERQKLTRNGRSARRAWEVRHTSNTAVRLEALEFEASKGT